MPRAKFTPKSKADHIRHWMRKTYKKTGVFPTHPETKREALKWGYVAVSSSEVSGAKAVIRKELANNHEPIHPNREEEPVAKGGKAEYMRNIMRKYAQNNNNELPGVAYVREQLAAAGIEAADSQIRKNKGKVANELAGNPPVPRKKSGAPKAKSTPKLSVQEPVNCDANFCPKCGYNFQLLLHTMATLKGLTQ